MTLAQTVTAALLVVAVAAPAAAQQTREEQQAAERAEKARTVRPPQPTTMERRLERLEAALGTSRRFYTFIGSAFPGGGFALGPGYRTRFADTGSVNAHAAWSIRNAKVAAATVKLPEFADRRVTIEATGKWMDTPRMAFYGVGSGSTAKDRRHLACRATTVGVSSRVRIAPVVTVGGGLDALDITSAADASALRFKDQGPSITYRRSRLFAEIDWRTSPAYTRSGGFYRLDWSDYHTNGGPYSFRRVDAEVDQFIPLLRENWVIALRAQVSSTDTAAGNSVPFYLMPDLGGGQSLRGYPSWRFRDRSRMLLTGEYRWTAGPFVDMAHFLDAGSVAARVRDLSLGDLQKSYGLGMSIHTVRAMVTRVEIARSREGTTLSFSFSPSF